MGRTLYDKIWDGVVHTEETASSILYIDRPGPRSDSGPAKHEGLREADLVWRISSIVATADHNADHRLRLVTASRTW
jgi:homoaconitase/3-isopropylmalate dehydratase large subunit